jgi:glutamyl-tRNA reductase
MERLFLLGLNHTTAPLDVRERLAFNAQQRAEAVTRFRQRFENCELVLLSTCNRVEFYTSRAVHGHPRTEEVIEFLAQFHGIEPARFVPHLYHKAEREAVEHLFHVASSLDSMVLGETQILGQVRDAYETCKGLSSVGPMLNPLFQRAIAVGKEVMHGTSLNEGRLSVASVAVDYAKGIFDHFDDKTVLCIGAGKMAALVLQSFVGLRPGRLLICNRSPEKAAALATRFGGQQVPFESLADHLVAADIVITSTGAAQPIITRPLFEGLRKRRRYRPIFLIDIAVPRDIEPVVGELDGVYLYNLDDLQQVVSETQAQRTDAIGSARAIVAKHIESFVAWHRQRELGPAIHRLYTRYHAIAQEELARTLNKLPNVTEAERAHLEDLARRIVNKLLHDPVQTLRHTGADHASAVPYLHALEKLFQLGEQTTETTPEAPPVSDDA